MDSMDRCFSAVVFFSPKKRPVAPTGFYIHSAYHYDYHSVSTFSVSTCLWMALVKHIVGYLLFLDAAF
jgi:hypothetical protein